jgi:predicted MarR family transcription regulator
VSRRAFDRWDWACYAAAGQLTPAQRAVLQVLARHVGENSGARISQATMAASAGIDERNVRCALRRLEALGLIIGWPQPGKPTIWELNLAYPGRQRPGFG